jgi:hypothetical protein
MPSFSDLLGPVGALIGAVAVAVVLWREHIKADAEDRKQRDAAFDDLRAQSAATGRVADSYTDIAKEIATLTAAVGVIATRVTAMERSMARRRRGDS